MRTKPNGNFDFFDLGVERLLRVCTVLILFRGFCSAALQRAADHVWRKRSAVFNGTFGLSPLGHA
jgi:hypothetical protein